MKDSRRQICRIPADRMRRILQTVMQVSRKLSQLLLQGLLQGLLQILRVAAAQKRPPRPPKIRGQVLALVNGSKEVATKALNGKIKAEAKTGGHLGGLLGGLLQPLRCRTCPQCQDQRPARPDRRRLGADEAPHVAACYVGSSNAFYVARRHSVDCLLRDCESLRTEWATGTRITATEARQMDQHEAGAEAARWVTENKEMLRQMRREGKI